MGGSLHTVKNQALIANYSMTGSKGCFIQYLSVVMIYSEGNLFVEGLLFRFYSHLKTFCYPVISTMLLFHTLGHAESILYVCSFKIYTLKRLATLSHGLVDQHNRIK